MIIERNFSKATIETYSSTIKRYLAYLDEIDMEIEEVTTDDINDYLKTLSFTGFFPFPPETSTY